MRRWPTGYGAEDGSRNGVRSISQAAQWSIRAPASARWSASSSWVRGKDTGRTIWRRITCRWCCLEPAYSGSGGLGLMRVVRLVRTKSPSSRFWLHTRRLWLEDWPGWRSNGRTVAHRPYWELPAEPLRALRWSRQVPAMWDRWRLL